MKREEVEKKHLPFIVPTAPSAGVCQAPALGKACANALGQSPPILTHKGYIWLCDACYENRASLPGFVDEDAEQKVVHWYSRCVDAAKECVDDPELQARFLSLAQEIKGGIAVTPAQILQIVEWEADL